MSFEDYEITWTARRCLCDDDVNGRECFCYDSPRCTCEDCQSAADAGRAERLADADYGSGVWL